MDQMEIPQLIENIKNHQNADGSFSGYSSDDPTFTHYKKTHTIFFTALILCALADYTDDQTHQIKCKAVKYLLGNKSIQWTWNYWDRSSPEAKRTPYPDDADDTFCALAGIYLYDTALLDGNALATITQGLTELETHEGGPYHTWYTYDDSWKDVDIAVNMQIRFFLSLLDIKLPSLEKFATDHILNTNLQSKYYPSIAPIIYFITRAHHKLPLKAQKQLIEIILSHLHTDRGTSVIETACYTSALIRLGYPTPIIMSISDMPIPFCLDPRMNGVQHYATSPALEAALILEARLLQRSIHNQPATKSHSIIMKDVQSHVSQRLLKVPAHIRKIIHLTMEKVTQAENIENILVPNHINMMLHQPLSSKILEKLCTAQLLGWIAYTIYDDVIDMDTDPAVVSAANICLRELTYIYLQTTPKSFHETFFTIMNTIDSENFWESQNCRNPKKLPSFKPITRIARKSIGHALGALAVVHMSNSSDTKNYLHLYKFFIHYITARQLADDAHDWEEDLKKNHITPVVARILREHIYHPQKTLPELYWHICILDICTQIEKHIRIAQVHLNQITCFTSHEICENILSSLTTMLVKTRTEQKNAVQFLTYHTNKK